MRQEAEPARVEVTEAAPGILRLELPISMPGLGHVNCYALEDERGWALVDPGLPGKQAWRALEGRAAAAGFRLDQVHTVVVTHSHIDHFGMAGRLREAVGATVVAERHFRTWWDPVADADVDPELEGAARPAAGTSVPGRGPKPWQGTTPWGGARPSPPRRVRLRYTLLRPLVRRWLATPSPSHRLADADVVSLGRRQWVAVHTPGHTPDHLCLLDPAGGVLLSGDHVLPTITPHISGLDAGPDPLRAFFASLERVHDLPPVSTVLPAHGHPFTDLHGRVKDIRRHHEERLARLRAAAEELGEASVPELSQRLFSARVWGPMAESETYAHLEHLRLAGVVERRHHGDALTYRLVA